jgi:hypothetical protein
MGNTKTRNGGDSRGLRRERVLAAIEKVFREVEVEDRWTGEAWEIVRPNLKGTSGARQARASTHARTRMRIRPTLALRDVSGT